MRVMRKEKMLKKSDSIVRSADMHKRYIGETELIL